MTDGYAVSLTCDEFPGQPKIDSGSSRKDWWQDAVKRPLGAYYRVDHRSVTDMQIALNEIVILYASAACHSGSRTRSDSIVRTDRPCSPAPSVLASASVSALMTVGYRAPFGPLVLVPQTS